MKPIEKITWEIGTAYDFLVSLILLHDPKRYGLRPKWASAIRQRLPQRNRDVLEMLMNSVVVSPPLQWIYDSVPEPKGAQNLLSTLRSLDSFDRVSAIIGLNESSSAYTEFAARIIKTKEWTDADLEEVKLISQDMGKPKSRDYLIGHLNSWVKLLDKSDEILTALQSYYDAFFAGEEYRVLTALQRGLKEAQKLAKELSFTEFFMEISQGVVYEEDAFAQADELIFAPSFWASPFVFMSMSKTPFYLFGARPDDTSLMPGEVVPDILIKSLNALSDPTRLRVLRYLSAEKLTPTQIANRLHLRTSTVAHHLNILRAAGLVVVQLNKKAKKEVYYATRTERIVVISNMINDFIFQDGGDSDGSKKTGAE